MSKIKVFITGSTGSMGFCTVSHLIAHLDKVELILLARPGKKNQKKLAPFRQQNGVKIIWGDLLDPKAINEGVKEADIILHMGALIPPASEKDLEKTMAVNVSSMKHIIDSVKKSENPDSKKVVYIGSISQYGDRKPPVHWARTGDPIFVSIGDCYSLSKALAEKMLADSGIKYWVSIRQTGMLCREMLLKGTDPLTFHVPLDGVLEWSTVEDSAVLMERLVLSKLPENFWRRFYNLGNGGSYRLSNIEFIDKILSNLSCPAPEKVFDTNWFAKKNFHGVWYADSELLENIIPFRSSSDCDAYMKELSKSVPTFFSLAKIVPSFLIKLFMRQIANKPDAPLTWIKEDPEGIKARAAFGSLNEWKNIPDWKYFRNLKPERKITLLDHGYDSSKDDDAISADDLNSAAEFRGGKCLTVNSFKSGEIDKLMTWECAFGHRFSSSPNTVLRGGHWCEECLKAREYEEEAKKNQFLNQALTKS